MTDKPTTTGLALLREPFPPHQISKLPKPTKQQTEEVRANFRAGIRCDICGSWHHPKVIHLDYVGHAAMTDRLLDCDPAWNWEPLAVDDYKLPVFDTNGGLWIKLTVCGVTRLGYGAPAEGKKGPDAVKEAIGDAIRNAAMRGGGALELWHKGDLHIEEPVAPMPAVAPAAERVKAKFQKPAPAPAVDNPVAWLGMEVVAGMREAKDLQELETWASRAKSLSAGEKAEARATYTERKRILGDLERAEDRDQHAEDAATADYRLMMDKDDS